MLQRQKKNWEKIHSIGTSEDCIDCIQVCGFEEAFDLWGCGHYQIPKVTPWGEYNKDKNGKRQFDYERDIQLKFDWETHSAGDHDDNGAWAKNCHKCFNEPCTCEIKEAFQNLYTVKREQDLRILKKEHKDKIVIKDSKYEKQGLHETEGPGK